MVSKLEIDSLSTGMRALDSRCNAHASEVVEDDRSRIACSHKARPQALPTWNSDAREQDRLGNVDLKEVNPLLQLLLLPPLPLPLFLSRSLTFVANAALGIS